MVTTTAMAAVIPSRPDGQLIDEVVALGSPAHALAIQLLGNRDDAADAVQDAMESALTKGRTFDAQRGSLKSWFFGIVRNRCIDELRRRSRSHRRASEIDPGDIAASDDPVSNSTRDEATATLLAHLKSLSREQREILILRDYLALPYAEIAAILAIPQGTVMSRLHRARTSLTERMNT